ncbi:MAG: mannose-1-phosphate guanylyltransferase [Deltaproteobacteria bacterium]
MYIVILVGGSGTRFWPLSRGKSPKQLMSILGGKSMLQRTVERVLPLAPKGIVVVTNAIQAPETAMQLELYQNDTNLHIVEEPEGRNTAPAIGLAAAFVSHLHPGALMVVLPADHYITDEEEFRRTIKRAVEPAQHGSLVTLGIVPTRPETGYGYIEVAPERHDAPPYPVRRFVEKPSQEKALEFLASGSFFWNSGMFVWRTDVILEQIKEHMPKLALALAALSIADDTGESSPLQLQIAKMYRSLTGESIDYAVMEKAANVVVIPGLFGWSDVGSWSALPEVIPHDAAGNVTINVREEINLDSSGCVVYGDGKLVALIGVSDLIVVNSGDAVLLCSMERAQDVKKIVEELHRRDLPDYL